MTARIGIFGEHKDHANYNKYCEITYWNLREACLPDAGPTHLKISPLGPHDYGSQEFACTASGYDQAFRLLSFIEKAYMRGMTDALADVRKVLRIKEPRS